jgi:deazaflavin-dependent oxidoreductase (nitroreductase family)
MTVDTWLRAQIATVAAGVLQVRPLMRAPVWIYRAGAGALLGPRLLMLEHTGRRSGLRRNVVLEVIGHPTPERYLVASGFGEKAQWFLNIQAHPEVRVYHRGRPPAAATARVLTPPEAGQILRGYAERHPRAWNRFKPVLERTLGRPIDESHTTLPIVELRLD